MPIKNKTSIQTILVSLLFLCQEAERVKLHAIRNIIKDTMSKIGIWVSEETNTPTASIFDEDIYYALLFLKKFQEQTELSIIDFKICFNEIQLKFREMGANNK